MTTDRALQPSWDGTPSLTADDWVRCSCDVCNGLSGRQEQEPIYVRRRLRRLPEHMTIEQQKDFALVLINAMACALEEADAGAEHYSRDRERALAQAAKPSPPTPTEADLQALIESLRKQLHVSQTRAGSLEKRLSQYIPEDTSIAADAVIGAVVRRAIRSLGLPNTEGIESWRPFPDETKVVGLPVRAELQRKGDR